MKRNIFLALLLFALLPLRAEDVPLRYVNALELQIINKGFSNTLTPYTRIPACLQDSVRPDLWARSLCSSGIAVRFASNSRHIAARYRLSQNFHMAHMADTGTKGTDLYCLGDDNRWHYVNTARPVKDSIQQKVYVSNLDGQMHEWMIYLPLYDGIQWFEVGVDSASVLVRPQVQNPVTDRRIVFYGTSIMQGGCASRTGMASTCLIQRDLGVECVNLGFSGEGKMDAPLARAMAAIPDVVAYVIDPVPNCTKDMCDTLTYGFVRILLEARPDVPVIMVEGLTYPYAHYDSFFRDYLPQKNEAFHNNYLRLKEEFPDNLYYVTTQGLTGRDEEGTVDGIHLTDLGFRAYADKLEEVLLPLLNPNK